MTVLGQSYGNLLIGTPLFWSVFSLFLPANLVNLHPLALAGWVGILVTAINLLPAGQLDGGHVFRALFGDRARFVSYGAVVLLFGLGLFYIGWLFFAILILFLGLRHPPPLNDITPIGTSRKLVGILVGAILVTGFVVVPLSTPAGAVSLGAGSATPVSSVPPGSVVATNLTLTINNEDPITHGFLFAATVVNVSVQIGNTTVDLAGPALTSWEANASWTVFLPHGRTVVLHGGSVSLPEPDYITLNGTGEQKPHALSFVIQLSDTEAAQGAGLTFTTNMFCAPSGGGSASTGLSLSFV